MRILNFLSGTPFVLLSLRAPDAGPSGGSAAPAASSTATTPAPAAAAPQATAEECPVIEGSSFEQKVENAGKLIKGLWDRLSASLAGQKKAEGEKLTIEGQFTALQTAAEGEKTAHGVTKGLLETEKGDHTKIKGELKTAQDNVTRLEGICGVKGLDKGQAVAADAGAAAGSDKAQEYLTLKKQESKGEVPRGTASKFYRQNKKEIAAAK